MNKAQALNNFWNSFGLKAYDENTLPSTTSFPYITYNTVTDSFDNVVNVYASLWYRDTSWKAISDKTEDIAKALSSGGAVLKLEKGYLWLCKGTPFAQRMSDPSDSMIRRMYLNVQAEYLTAY